MGITVTADDALFAALARREGDTLHTPPDSVLSWPALHLLVEHGFRWAQDGAPVVHAGRDAGADGLRVHVDLTIEHPPHRALVLGRTPQRFLTHAFGIDAEFAPREAGPALAPEELTRAAERRSPASTTVVVRAVSNDGQVAAALGGVLVVERGPAAVNETLRVMVGAPADETGAPRSVGAVRDGLEAGLQAVSQGRHPQAGLFATSTGRVDGVVDARPFGPPAPLAVFVGARGVRAGALAERAPALGGTLVGSSRMPGVFFGFAGDDAARWRAAARLAESVGPETLRRTRVPRQHERGMGNAMRGTA